MGLDDGTKMWWESDTIRGIAFGMVAVVGLALNLDTHDRDSLMTIVMLGCAFGGQAFAWWGRVRATQTIDKRLSLPLIYDPRRKS